MRQLDKPDVIGRRIIEIIVSTPDKPVSMSDQSYSKGYLRLDTGHVIDIGACAPPFMPCDESELRNLRRDKKTEKKFSPAINQTIVEMILPDEADEADEAVIRFITSNGFVIRYALGLFWIRPIIEQINMPTSTAVDEGPTPAPRRPWWKIW